jgi:predicted metalloprotease with PDZ domain
MISETYLDFCFIREQKGEFAPVIDELLKKMFGKKRLNWFLEEKAIDGAEMVIAEVKGMSDWDSEEDTIQFIEDNADPKFWDYLQGYKLFIYPVKKGCNSCGTH